MKTVNKALIFVLLPLLSIACGDEEKPVPIQKKITKEYVFTAPIRGLKGTLIASKELDPIFLADIIGEEAANNIVGASIHNAACYLEIKGLKNLSNPTTLKDFTLQIKGKQAVNFGHCTSNPEFVRDFESDTEQSTDEVLSFIRNILNTYTSGNQSAQIILSFTSTEDILENNVNLSITITADYIYNSYR